MASIVTGEAWTDFYCFTEDPRFLGDMIISYPLRGLGTEKDPYHRTLRLSTADGRFICEIDTWKDDS
jgi:hypothetical protein